MDKVLITNSVFLVIHFEEVVIYLTKDSASDHFIVQFIGALWAASVLLYCLKYVKRRIFVATSSALSMTDHIHCMSSIVFKW